MVMKNRKMKTNLFQMSHQKNQKILRNHLKVKVRTIRVICTFFGVLGPKMINAKGLVVFTAWGREKKKLIFLEKLAAYPEFY